MNTTISDLNDSYIKAKLIFKDLENNVIKNNLEIDFILNNFDSLIKKNINTYGRIISHRNSKMFLVIRHKFYDIQCLFPNEDKNKKIKKILYIGDYIGISGYLEYSNTKEKTIFIKNLIILSKCIRNIPDQYFIQNKQEKYQLENRTMFLTFNKEALRTISIRFAVIQEIRRFLYECNFIEADTPTLCKIAGGAMAKPFKTDYLVNKETFSLRIAPELYLKRFIISGFPRVFEICHNFRNEGISAMHNPEFTMLEVYEVNIYLEDVIQRSIQLIKNIVLFLNKNYNCKINIDFQNTESKKFYDIINNINPNIYKFDIDELKHFANSLGINTFSNNKYDIYDDIVSKYYIPKHYKDKLFILTHHPKELSPLSKINEQVALRFEIYIFGLEIVDGYEENNNADKQYQIFKEQERINNRESDMSFCDDLKIGMMQTCGYGVGIDRLIKILLKQNFIRDVIPFIE